MQKETTEKPHAPNGQTDQPPVLYEDPNNIERSPFNRSVRNQELGELIDSIRLHGIIEPLIVRHRHAALGSRAPKPAYQLIAGERRWRSALLAKIGRVPIIVRPATDRQVIELQTVENDQREDLTPIERAEKYQQLRDQYMKEGLSASAAVEEVAKRVGKKRSTVYEALKLLQLTPALRQAVEKGELPASHATLVAMLADFPDLQKKAAEEITDAEEWDDSERSAAGNLVLSFRESKRLVDDTIKLGVKRKAWDRMVAEAKAKKQKVLDDRETRQARARGCVAATDNNWDYASPNSYKALMGKHAPTPIIGRDLDFNVLELYEKEAAKDAIKANGRKPSSPGINRSAQARGSVAEAKRMKAQAAKTRRETAERRMIVAAVVEAAKKPTPNARQGFEFAMFMLRAMKQRILSDTTREMFNRRGLKPLDFKKKGSLHAPHHNWLKQELAKIKNIGEARALMVDMAIAMDLTMWAGEYGDKLPNMLDVACKVFGVDPKRAIRQAVSEKVIRENVKTVKGIYSKARRKKR